MPHGEVFKNFIVFFPDTNFCHICKIMKIWQELGAGYLAYIITHDLYIFMPNFTNLTFFVWLQLTNLYFQKIFLHMNCNQTKQAMDTLYYRNNLKGNALTPSKNHWIGCHWSAVISKIRNICKFKISVNYGWEK